MSEKKSSGGKIAKIVFGLFVVAAIALAVYAFLRTNRSPADVFQGDNLLAGYDFNTLPTAIESNGYIYAVNKSTHEKWWITSLSLPDTSQPVSLPQDSSLVTASVGSVFKWMANGTTKDSSANLALSNTVKVKLTLKDAQLTKTPILTASDAIAKATDQIGTKLQQLVTLSDYDFFIILESIRVKSLDYQFDKSVADNAGFKAALKRLAEVSPGVKFKENQTSKVSFTDDAYRVVLYKAFPLHVRSSLGGNYEITIE